MAHNFPQGCNVILDQELDLPLAKTVLKTLLQEDIPASDILFEDGLIDSTYRYIGWDGEDIEKITLFWDKNPSPTDLIVTLEEFKKFCKGRGTQEIPVVKELELNSNYKAIVTKKDIQVGCQTFDHKTLADLYKLSLEVQGLKK